MKIMMFSANWCGPCKMLKPIVKRVEEATDSLNVRYIDVDEEKSLSASYNIRGIPTLLQVDDEGKVLSTKIGAISEKELKTWLGV